MRGWISTRDLMSKAPPPLEFYKTPRDAAFKSKFGNVRWMKSSSDGKTLAVYDEMFIYVIDVINHKYHRVYVYQPNMRVDLSEDGQRVLIAVQNNLRVLKVIRDPGMGSPLSSVMFRVPMEIEYGFNVSASKFLCLRSRQQNGRLAQYMEIWDFAGPRSKCTMQKLYVSNHLMRIRMCKVDHGKLLIATQSDVTIGFERGVLFPWTDNRVTAKPFVQLDDQLRPNIPKVGSYPHNWLRLIQTQWDTLEVWNVETLECESTMYVWPNCLVSEMMWLDGHVVSIVQVKLKPAVVGGPIPTTSMFYHGVNPIDICTGNVLIRDYGIAISPHNGLVAICLWDATNRSMDVCLRRLRPSFAGHMSVIKTLSQQNGEDLRMGVQWVGANGLALFSPSDKMLYVIRDVLLRAHDVARPPPPLRTNEDILYRLMDELHYLEEIGSRVRQDETRWPSQWLFNYIEKYRKAVRFVTWIIQVEMLRQNIEMEKTKLEQAIAASREPAQAYYDMQRFRIAPRFAHEYGAVKNKYEEAVRAIEEAKQELAESQQSLGDKMKELDVAVYVNAGTWGVDRVAMLGKPWTEMLLPQT